jgi:hypothetical protein
MHCNTIDVIRFRPKIVDDALLLLRNLQVEDALQQSMESALHSRDLYRLEGVLQQLIALGDTRNKSLLLLRIQVEGLIAEVLYTQHKSIFKVPLLTR